MALLAVLKAGGAYVPLDPGYAGGCASATCWPGERVRWRLLAHGATRTRFADAEVPVPVLDLDTAAPEWASRPPANPEAGDLTPDHLCYVIYTSGSTGRPKGVMTPAPRWRSTGWHAGAGGLGDGRGRCSAETAR